MGIQIDLQVLGSSVVSSVKADTVTALYTCVAAALGFDTSGGAAMEGTQVSTVNMTGILCACDEAGLNQNGTKCKNSSCLYNPCTSFYTDFGTVFASISYALLAVAIIQLILVMVHDALQEDKGSRWRKAFRFTIQKCLLGAVILATGSRAIYYTIQSIIPDKWGDILLNVYYPSLLSAFSLLICFWAEFFYTSSNLVGQDFLKKHQYSATYLAFNIIVYLLLVADIIATPLISDQEQIRLSGIVGTIFAFFLLVTLIGFLHFAIRLFFRPDWQPLFVQLAVLRINLRQQLASVLGVVSNALMQSLIISLLVFNMVVRYIPVNSYNLYVCAVVIRVTELILPLWFCCSLWNFKQPKRLWILNPGALIQTHQETVEDAEAKPLLSSHSPTHVQYGSIGAEGQGSESTEDGCCWVCLGNDDPSDLFYPCNCQLHRKCIHQWIAKRASDANVPEKEYMRCQVCRKKYRGKKSGCLFSCRGMQRSHWVQLVGMGILVLCSVLGLAFFGVYSSLDTSKKTFIICGVAIVETGFIKFLAVRMALFLRKSAQSRLDIQGYTPAEWRARKRRRAEAKRALGQAVRSFTTSSSNSYSSSGGDAVLFTASQNTLEISSSTSRESVSQVIAVEISPS